MNHFQLVDEKGLNWGLALRKKSDRILKLLKNSTTLLKEEGNHARKLSREMKGFGSFLASFFYHYTLAFSHLSFLFNTIPPTILVFYIILLFLKASINTNRKFYCKQRE